MKYCIPTSPWKYYEELILKIGRNEEYDPNPFSDEICFLKDLKFISSDDTKLIDDGMGYYIAKFVNNDNSASDEILYNALIHYKPVQLICQILWGVENVSKKSIYNLLCLRDYVNPKDNEIDDLSSFLMILNKTKIISYCKRMKTIAILYNPNKELENDDFESYFVDTEKPYSNLLIIKNIVRACNKYIYWFEKHFTKKIFEILIEETDGTKIDELRLLFGIVGINIKMRKEFKRFKSELENRGVYVELRVICDRRILDIIHGRWILSQNLCFNIPPTNTILQGQADEIKKTKNRPPFESWWRDGKNLINEWNEIDRFLINEVIS
jgi:hypothetical protein